MYEKRIETWWNTEVEYIFTRRKNLKIELKWWLIIRNVNKEHKIWSIKWEIFCLLDIPSSLGNALPNFNTT